MGDFIVSKLWIPIALILLLGGCTAAARTAVKETTLKLQDTADTAAQVLLVAPCAMTVGSLYRLDNPNQKAGVDLLCGGP